MPTEALGEGRLIEASARYSPQRMPQVGREHGKSRSAWQLCGSSPATTRPIDGTLWGREQDMNPEIRAILFGLLIAALACPAILVLLYSP